ncbi:putative AminoAcid/AuxinPermease(AAAP) Family Protein [Monocercomonoides exilis]|uniref:putative AminoAcid/AuxinPermease(AAAP) Family Protein n=1 Tax=Monocercomonoides exilis TaxID=2049356 RepID=UPI00355946A9|nr:putative AminoAcid/AuxinPermease(AAAP) Family Protein [Monocercomonoides exilis]|eukprot:MONOS_8282.1-p1 / transcript=MONOS_8282.1 / gene=MONOS_8282 / organism=Monocercomonoides_exilis_PA203 / gene_product=AminoAcid/AuxinPermease(AAAP) Family Protein / transcript_product=AminoAcid/AuxinPermease(AAAP) Family Protein / location=Mono_scaffold00308:43694-46242(+) / protein_length=829 / sequence_SO=supercontig / SO=protein_coding / is_pseudo=false
MVFQKKEKAQKTQELVRPSNTLFPAVITLVTSTLGAGLLGVPLAYAKSGIVVALIMNIFVQIISFLSMVMVLYVTDASGVYSLGGLTAKYFGGWGLILVECCTFMFCFGCLWAYVILISDFVPSLLRLAGLNPNSIFAQPWFTVIVFGLFILQPLSWFRSMEALKFTSFLGTASMAFCIVVIIIRCFNHTPSMGQTPAAELVHPSIKMIQTFSTLIFSICCHQNVPLVMGGLKGRSRETMIKVTIVQSLIVGLLYISAGAFGYMCFTTGFFSSSHAGNILIMFDDHDVLAVVARAASLVTVTFCFPVQMLPARLALKNIGTMIYRAYKSMKKEKEKRKREEERNKRREKEAEAKRKWEEELNNASVSQERRMENDENEPNENEQEDDDKTDEDRLMVDQSVQLKMKRKEDSKEKTAKQNISYFRIVKPKRKLVTQPVNNDAEMLKNMQSYQRADAYSTAEQPNNSSPSPVSSPSSSLSSSPSSTRKRSHTLTNLFDDVALPAPSFASIFADEAAVVENEDYAVETGYEFIGGDILPDAVSLSVNDDYEYEGADDDEGDDGDGDGLKGKSRKGRGMRLMLPDEGEDEMFPSWNLVSESEEKKKEREDKEKAGLAEKHFVAGENKTDGEEKADSAEKSLEHFLESDENLKKTETVEMSLEPLSPSSSSSSNHTPNSLSSNTSSSTTTTTASTANKCLSRDLIISCVMGSSLTVIAMILGYFIPQVNLVFDIVGSTAGVAIVCLFPAALLLKLISNPHKYVTRKRYYDPSDAECVWKNQKRIKQLLRQKRKGCSLKKCGGVAFLVFGILMGLASLAMALLFDTSLGNNVEF